MTVDQAIEELQALSAAGMGQSQLMTVLDQYGPEESWQNVMSFERDVTSALVVVCIA